MTTAKEYRTHAKRCFVRAQEKEYRTHAKRCFVRAQEKEYRTHAKRCFVRAQETDSEELRQASLEMASYWMDAAMRIESLGNSCIEPEQQAA
jgi:hypothetical protein